MKNFLGLASTLTGTAPVALAAGAGALIGGLFGVSKTTLAAGTKGPFEVVGKFELPKDNTAAAEWGKAYWDNANRVVTATAAGNTLIGTFTGARLTTDTLAHVRLSGAPTA